MSIPHKHSEKIDVSLKIGRYTLPFRNVETQKPKSELTLDNEELNALVRYISENYVPVNLGSGKYISVSDDDEELINKFKELVENNSGKGHIQISRILLSESMLPLLRLSFGIKSSFTLWLAFAFPICVLSHHIPSSVIFVFISRHYTSLLSAP